MYSVLHKSSPLALSHGLAFHKDSRVSLSCDSSVLTVTISTCLSSLYDSIATLASYIIICFSSVLPVLIDYLLCKYPYHCVHVFVAYLLEKNSHLRVFTTSLAIHTYLFRFLSSSHICLSNGLVPILVSFILQPFLLCNHLISGVQKNEGGWHLSAAHSKNSLQWVWTHPSIITDSTPSTGP